MLRDTYGDYATGLWLSGLKGLLLWCDSDIDLASFTSADGFKITAASSSDRTGSAVATGDVNGDGVADIIIGAEDADPSGKTDAGVVYVIWGNQTSGEF